MAFTVVEAEIIRFHFWKYCTELFYFKTNKNNNNYYYAAYIMYIIRIRYTL